MDITAFISKQRDNGLTVGSHSTFRTSLSCQLHSSRKRLSLLSPRNGFKPKMDSITAEQIQSNPEYARIFILTCERARAHALSLKDASILNSADKEISGRSRSQIVSRLAKAAAVAGRLVGLVTDGAGAKATSPDELLEVIAYQYSLLGEHDFEKHSLGMAVPGQDKTAAWKLCLEKLAVARTAYDALFKLQGRDCFKEMLAQVVDSSMEYASYRAHGTRSVDVVTLAGRYFPVTDAALKSAVEKVYPAAFQADSATQAADNQVRTTVVWREMTVPVSDAAIGRLLGRLDRSKLDLTTALAELKTKPAKQQAAAFDGVLEACQDSSDRVRQAIEEMQRENVDEADEQMLNLRMVNLVVSYELIRFRVGRDRVLLGPDDGLRADRSRKGGRKTKGDEKDGGANQSSAGRVGRLKERLMLYDSILQSIGSIKLIPGAARDASFVDQLDGQYRYFRALRCLNLGYFHAARGSASDALGLIVRAEELVKLAATVVLTAGTELANGPAGLDVAGHSTEAAVDFITRLRIRFHGLVEIQTAVAKKKSAAAKWEAAASAGVPAASRPTLVDRLAQETPAKGIDPSRLVDWPGRLKPVPIKPVYLDLAWDYVRYPGQSAVPPSAPAAIQTAESETKTTKKGWFW